MHFMEVSIGKPVPNTQNGKIRLATSMKQPFDGGQHSALQHLGMFWATVVHGDATLSMAGCQKVE